MRGIYFTTICNIEDDTDNTLPGIKEKIRRQVEFFRKHGVDLFYCYAGDKAKKSMFHKYVNRLPFYRDRYRVNREMAAEADFIYVRKPLMINMGLIDLLRKLRKENPKIKILMEVPTYPYDNEIKGIFQMLYLIKDRYARKRLHRYVDVILTFSEDKEIFGIKTINTCNGVDTKAASDALTGKTHPDDGTIRIMACARFDYWHGYDRAIEGLRSYIRDPRSDKRVELEMVGDGPMVDGYKELVEEYGLQEYVRFHGRLLGDDLTKVYAISNIGLDSMGRHRSGVFYNSSLKGKEYCAYGLVVVSGVKTELDNDESFDYYYRIPADDSPVDFNKLIDFYNTVTDNGRKREEVRKAIMQYASEHFSMDVVLKPVLDYICG